jgi:hypothetical protein
MYLENNNTPTGFVLTVIFLAVSLAFKAVSVDFKNIDIFLSIITHIIQIIAAGTAIFVGYLTIVSIREKKRNKGV